MASLTRRDVLQVAAMMAATSISRGADPSVGDGFVDAHSHIWTNDVARYPLVDGQPASKLAPPTFTAEELLAIAKPVGVSRIVLIQHKPYFGVDNRYLEVTIAKFPGVFAGVACINAEFGDQAAEMKRLKQAGFRGFRIRPGEGAADSWAESAGICRMWATAAAEDLAICPLIGPDDISQVVTMSQKYPETTVVVDHFARVGMNGDFPENQLKLLDLLASRPRVHLKISAFYFLGSKKPPYRELIPMIRRVYEAFGPDRLMWGSDCPYQLGGENNYKASIDLIRSRVEFLSASDRQKILRETCTRVFFR